MAEVWTGQLWNRALRNLPPRPIVDFGVSVFSRIAHGLRCDFTSKTRPMAMSLLGATMQRMCVHEALLDDGERAAMPWFRSGIDAASDVPEHNLLNASHATAKARKKALADPKGIAESLVFDPTRTYSFDAYQNVFDANAYVLHIGAGLSIDVSKHLGGTEQCIEVNAVRDDGQYLWCFEIWNQRALQL